MKVRDLLFAVNLLALWPERADAHVSEQGFVLLLPTDIYISVGVGVVALTVLALLAMPQRFVDVLFSHRPLDQRDFGQWPVLASMLSCFALWFVIYVGVAGPRDPLSNLMPLGFWTVGWVALVSCAVVFGNLWTWINPWSGIYALIGSPKPIYELPSWATGWPPVLLLIGFAGFLLADPAPDDPTRLAYFAAAYWGGIFAGLMTFGPAFLCRVELGHAVFAAVSSMAPLRIAATAGIGGPGWQLTQSAPFPWAGLFALTFLAVGSFDGLNETFWWLGVIGVNPLEFPGRSAVIGVTLGGLALSICGLYLVFAAAVWLGAILSGKQGQFWPLASSLALSVLPIALVYHMAHYLTSFMVGIQYTIAAISDPFAQGADLLGIDPFRVTTGFFNRIDTVRLIWMTQAGLIVIGHVWSVLLAHKFATQQIDNQRKATIATLPLSLFMIAYTFLGLWLLAAPKGA